MALNCEGQIERRDIKIRQNINRSGASKEVEMLMVEGANRFCLSREAP